MTIVLSVLLLALLGKFLLPFFLFDVPMGYDAGLYRYLFLSYSEAFPPFVWPDLAPWAREHPVGLFLFSTIFLKLGLPVDWLIGWIWHVMPVALAGVLAWVMAQREGKIIGLLVLFAALISQAYYDGFVLMYWKTELALFFMIFAFHFLERQSMFFFFFGILTIITHHQTGLLFGLSVASWWLFQLPRSWRDPVLRRMTVFFLLIPLIGLLFYIPLWDRAIWSPLYGVLTLRGDAAPGGSFPESIFYLRLMGILLGFGIAGWIISFRREWGSLWQFAVFWSAVFIIFRLVFYRRFFLQFDFFLLPFVALAIREACIRWRYPVIRFGCVLFLLVQGFFSIEGMRLRSPMHDADTLATIAHIASVLPDDAFVLAIENRYAPWVRGLFPDHQVGAPGLFDFPWTVEMWRTFVYGNHEERRQLLQTLDGPVYLIDTPFFHEFYGESADQFLQDPCFAPTEEARLFRSLCSSLSL